MEDERDMHGGPVEIPVTGELDLHAFAPEEVKSLLDEYIRECAGRGILDLRIVHGKGKGILRNLVRRVLDSHPLVTGYRSGDETSGSWGATLVRIRPLPDADCE